MRGPGRLPRRPRRLPPPDAVTVRLALLAVLVSGAAAAQPDVVGTWELEAAETLPDDGTLVFVRLTVTDQEIETLTVTLWPNGDLTGDRVTSRYLASDGQLVVRRLASVALWDVARDRDRLVIRDAEAGLVLRLRRADPAAAVDPALVGSWVGERGGRPFALRLQPDGTAEVGDPQRPDAGRWAAAGAYLVLGDDPARYTLARGADGARQLVVEADGERTTFRWVAGGR